MKELSDKLSQAFSRDELNVLCFELGLDPDELDYGTKSELIWQIVGWCQRRGKVASLIALCREQRPHISWPDPPKNGMDISEIDPPGDEFAGEHTPFPRATTKWVIGSGFLLVVLLGAWALISMFNNFTAGPNTTGSIPTSAADADTSQVVEGNDSAGTDTPQTVPQLEGDSPAVSTSELQVGGLAFEENQVLGHGDDVASVTWSPEGERLATGSRDGQIKVWDVATGQIVRTLTSERQGGQYNLFHSVAWSPTGDFLLSGDDAIHLWNAETGEEVQILEEVVGDVGVVGWSPDNVRFAWGNRATGKGAVTIWDLATMQEQLSLSGHGNWVSDFAWSPDGSLLASAGENNMIHIWNGGTGAELYIFSRHAGWINGLAWSPDGALLASVSEDSTLRIIEADSGQQNNVFEFSDTVNIASVDWSPNGDLLAVAGVLAISPSGNWEYMWVLDAQTGEKLYAFTGHSKDVTDLAWSPDGTMLASASLDDTARVWQLNGSE